MEIACLLDAKALIGESPLWDDRTGHLWWVDIRAHTLNRLDPSSGVNETWEMGEPVGCAAVRTSGGLIVAARSGFRAFDAQKGFGETLSAPLDTFPGHRFNDGTTDRQGRFWAGSVRDGYLPPMPAEGAFYCLDADHSCRKVFGDFYTTNGTAFSPDGRTMYFSDSQASVRTVWKCDYDPDTGSVSNRSIFFDTHGLAGRCDGATVDSDGCYWMAAINGWQILRITPAGVVDRAIDLPVERPSCPAFGGPNRDTLYVTTLSVGLTPDSHQPFAGGILAITNLGVTGIADTPFPGRL